MAKISVSIGSIVVKNLIGMMAEWIEMKGERIEVTCSLIEMTRVSWMEMTGDLIDNKIE